MRRSCCGGFGSSGSSSDFTCASARVRPAAEALRDDPSHAAITRCGEQMVGSRSAQSVAVCEGGIELAQVRSAFQIGEFVHDDVRVRGDDGRPNGPFVECVSDHRFGAEFPHESRLRRRVHQSGYRMACANQTWDQPASDGAGRARNENTHWVTSHLLTYS